MSNSFWEVAYRQNIAKMIGVCCRYTQNRQIAEDLAHDAFLVAIDKVSSFENKGPFEAWLRRIVVNVALQYLREQKRQQKWELAHADNGIADEIQEENPVHNDRGFSEAELLEVIANLPEHHRLVFNLYVIDHFTHAQIAASLGISEGTSKSHLARARKKLRQLLEDKLKNDTKRKRAMGWLMLFYRISPIDSMFVDRLNNFAIPPRKELQPDISTAVTAVPIPKTSGITYATYVKTGVIAIAAAVFLTGGPRTVVDTGIQDIAPPKYQVSDSTYMKFSGPISATISENPIIVEKTKESESMKNLSTLAGIVVTSLAVDHVGLSTSLPNAFENHRPIISPAVETKPANVEPVVKRIPALVSGSFYASKLLWSADRKLYFFGDHINVDVGPNKFTGSGKFSFLDQVHYLIVDGASIEQNQTIKLQEKKYSLVMLDGPEGVRKYGEHAKSGVLEITLAE